MPVMPTARSGKLFLILGPSGTGKGTAIRYLRREFPDAVFPVSATTRAPRPAEREGEVYNYLSKEEFKRRIDAGDFLEWAIVHNDNMYGTLKEPIESALAAGKIVIREVDMQGVESIRRILPAESVIAIFITAPSWENLKHRILGRSKIPEAELVEREKSFMREMEFSKKCDYVVMSEEGRIDDYCRKVAYIIKKETVNK